MNTRKTTSLILLTFVTLAACSQPAGKTAPPPAVSVAPIGTTVPTAPAPIPADTPSKPVRPAPLAVIRVGEGNTLPLYSEPGSSHEIVATLMPNTTDLQATGNRAEVQGSQWVEIQPAAGGTGWTESRYLTTQISHEKFCADERAASLVQKFIAAVQTRDRQLLASVVSPGRGVTIRYTWWNPEVSLSKGQFTAMFEGQASFDWGIEGGSGRPIQGSVNEVILPLLEDVLSQDFTLHCETLETGVATGGTAGQTIWPFEYTNIHYFAVYRAGAQGDELNWRTWAIGIEYIAGQPYITILVQYMWEI